MKIKQNKVLIAIGIALLATAVLSYFGIIPFIIASIATDPQDPKGHGLLVTIDPTQDPILTYVKIDKNGENVYEEYFPSGPATSPLDIFVYSEPGDIIEISAKWKTGLSMYAKVKINKLPSYNFDEGCIQVLMAGRNDVPSHGRFMLVYYKYEGDSSYIPSKVLWIESDDIELVTTTATITVTATYTTTTTEVVTTTTTSIITKTITYPYTTTIVYTVTGSIVETTTRPVTITDTYTTEIPVTTTDIDENIYAPNILTLIVLGIAGISAIILGFRKPS